MRSAKGQEAAELMLVYATAFAIFLLFYAMFAQQYANAVRQQAFSDGISMADRIASELDIAARAGDGYQRRITYATSIPGAMNYTFKINNQSGSVDLEMDLGNDAIFSYSSPTLTRNITTGELRYDAGDGTGFWLVNTAIESPRGSAYVENVNGTVTVTQMRVG